MTAADDILTVGSQTIALMEPHLMSALKLVAVRYLFVLAVVVAGAVASAADVIPPGYGRLADGTLFLIPPGLPGHVGGTAASTCAGCSTCPAGVCRVASSCGSAGCGSAAVPFVTAPAIVAPAAPFAVRVGAPAPPASSCPNGKCPRR